MSLSRHDSYLHSATPDLLLISPEIQFSLRDNVKPVYRELVDLLLHTGNIQQPSQDNLKRAIQDIDSLQLTELENFLGCKLSQLTRIDEDVSDPAAAKLYPIILPSRLAMIFELPGQPLEYREISLSQPEIEATVKTLRDNLTEPGRTPEVIEEAKKIYQWLIAPLEPILIRHPEINTLVFVLDGTLRNIPMGVLYDGEQYLIEKKYAIAVSPSLELFRPTSSSERLNVFRGGVEIPQVINGKSFPAIGQLREELTQIPEKITSLPPLLNEEFTKANIEKKLQTNRFSAIHWKTHGVFSSDPSETYLVAYQDTITIDDLVELVQSAYQSRNEPLELLVLSACETAQGDNRAVLGLAGIAVRTGARSTISTLWRADDDANTKLTTQFYQRLSQSSTTKAEALRQAQLDLLKESGYPAPYYWATYILVGNWL
jgi:CHAT domain-containing protein